MYLDSDDETMIEYDNDGSYSDDEEAIIIKKRMLDDQDDGVNPMKADKNLKAEYYRIGAYHGRPAG